MENLQLLIQKIDDLIIEKSSTKATSPKGKSINEFVLYGLGVLLAVSIGLFPKWVSLLILGIVVIDMALIWLKRHKSPTVNCPDNNVLLSLREIKSLAVKTSLLTDSKNAEIMTQANTISQLKEELRQLKNEKPLVFPDEVLAGRFKLLLETMQLLDVATQDFGKECHTYVRKEIEKAARKSGFRFEDYSEEMADCYEVEKTGNKITTVDYVTRALLSNSNNKVFLRGQVYIP